MSRGQSPSRVSAAQVRAFRLARQHLTDPLPPERLVDIVSAVLGVQAQVMSAAELAVAARSQGLSPGHVQEALWEKRELVKTWCMRGTLHLLPARELGLWAAGLSRRQQWRRPAWLKWFGATEEEMEQLIATIGKRLDGEGMTREEVAALAPEHLRTELLRGWGSHLKPAAYAGVLAFGPNRGRNVTFVQPERWLGAPLDRPDPDDGLRELFLRYLGAYGPATHEDFARWWGGDSAPARRILKSLGEEIQQVEAEGRLAWVLADDAKTIGSLDPPRSVHLLPNFDVYTLHYRPREAFLPDGVYDRVYRTAGWISPVVLYDGAVAGVWEHKKRSRKLDLSVELFVRPTKRLRDGIAREARRIGEFLGAPVELQL